MTRRSTRWCRGMTRAPLITGRTGITGSILELTVRNMFPAMTTPATITAPARLTGTITALMMTESCRWAGKMYAIITAAPFRIICTLVQTARRGLAGIPLNRRRIWRAMTEMWSGFISPITERPRLPTRIVWIPRI